MGIAAIEEMVAQQDCDWVMVELTGIADPCTSPDTRRGAFQPLTV